MLAGTASNAKFAEVRRLKTDSILTPTLDTIQETRFKLELLMNEA